MRKHIRIDGADYAISSFSDKSQLVVEQLFFSVEILKKLHDESAILLRAKNGYISDLKMEIIEKKSGLDLNTLFDDD